MVAVVCATGMSMTPPSGCVALHVPGAHEPVGVPAQAPCPVHTSPVVQGMPSSHVVPGGSGRCVQPVAATQASAVQGLPSLQSSAVPPLQVPDWQACPVRHALTAHAVPSAAAVCTH